MPSHHPQSLVVTPVLLPAVGALQVSQEPAELRVAVGTNVSLWCQLVTTEPWSMARIAWLKDGEHEVLCTTRLYPKAAVLPCATPRLQLAWSPPHAKLSLHGAQQGDAGCYVCCFTIEKPYLAVATCEQRVNGTLLHVSTGIQEAQGGGLCSAAPHRHPQQHLVGSVGRGTPRSVTGDVGSLDGSTSPSACRVTAGME